MSEEIGEKLFNAEIKRKAKAIILQACQKNNLDKIEDIEIRETEHGNIEFLYSSKSHMGDVEIRYSPQPFVEDTLRKIDAEFESKSNEEDFQNIPPECQTIYTEEAVALITQLLIYNLVYENIGFAPDLAMMAVMGFDFLEMVDESSQTVLKLLTRTDTERKAKLDQMLNALNKRRRTAILDFEKQALSQISAPQFIFCDIYEINLKVWQEANTFYKANKKNRRINVFELVKMAFSMLDIDLIYKLEFQEPAEIAFEASARYLNISPNIGNSETSRKTYVRQSRDQRNLVTQEEAEAAYRKYVLFWKNKFADDERKQKIISDFYNNQPH